MSGSDFAAWTFPLLMGLAVLYLFRMDRDHSVKFRLAQLISDRTGEANSASLAYVAALLVSTWLIWYEAVNGRMTDLLFAAYIGAFVAGGVARSAIGAKARRELQQGAGDQPGGHQSADSAPGPGIQ